MNYYFVGFACAAVPVIKQNPDDDQENISDFDDDIAAEVAAAVATAKSPVMTTQLDAMTSRSTMDSLAPQHEVTDFLQPPGLKKNTTTNSFLLSRGVSNNSNHFIVHAGYNDSYWNNGIIGIICVIVVVCVISLSLLMMFVLKMIVSQSNVISNYKR